MKLKSLETALFIGLIAALLVGGANADSEKLSDKVIRLHVVANSDSAEDQFLKLKVRDKVLELTGEMELGADSTEAAAVLKSNLEEIESTVLNMVQDMGYDLDVRATLGTEEFETRVYDTFSLPAGEYTSLRIILGSGEGKNWWCVVFPPICMASCTEELTAEALSVGLDKNDVALIMGENDVYILKFRLIELVQSVKMMYNKM